MKFVVAILAAGLSCSAFSQTVTIAGRTHGTGLLLRPKDAPRVYFRPSIQAGDLPESYDARDDAVIPPIRNQGQCGSCWDFATTGAFETALVKAGKVEAVTVDLSEQDQLVNNHSAYGCDGGFMDGTFLQEEGEALEKDCPYRANDRVSCRAEKYAKATKWALLGESGRSPTVDEIKAGIYQYGSLFVTVAAGGAFNPRGGRITSCSSRGINHMVQLVGYRPAAEGGVEFLIKNSWGTSWGDNGYAWSKQGCNQLANDPGDAAGFFYVEGDTPQPKPVVVSGVAEEYVATPANPVVMSVVPVNGVTYTWTAAGQDTTGDHVTVQSTASTMVTLKAVDQSGAVTQKVVKLTIH
jgi:C1A family cysteine protease